MNGHGAKFLQSKYKPLPCSRLSFSTPNPYDRHSLHSVSAGTEIEWRVLITAHQAFLTTEALGEIARVTVANLTALSKGQPFLEDTALA